MFDIAPSEFLLIAIVAIVVIGPKDLPLALRTAGQWIARVRRVSNHFEAGVETMIREAEMEEMERKWREQNAAIMATSATGGATGDPLMIDHAVNPATGYAAPDYAHHDQDHGAATPIDPLLVAHAPTDPVHMLPLAQPHGPDLSGPDLSAPDLSAPDLFRPDAHTPNPERPDPAVLPQSDHTA